MFTFGFPSLCFCIYVLSFSSSFSLFRTPLSFCFSYDRTFTEKEVAQKKRFENELKWRSRKFCHIYTHRNHQLVRELLLTLHSWLFFGKTILAQLHTWTSYILYTHWVVCWINFNQQEINQLNIPQEWTAFQRQKQDERVLHGKHVRIQVTYLSDRLSASIVYPVVYDEK